jgi:hypothetical protein
MPRAGAFLPQQSKKNSNNAIWLSVFNRADLALGRLRKCELLAGCAEAVRLVTFVTTPAIEREKIARRITW